MPKIERVPEEVVQANNLDLQYGDIFRQVYESQPKPEGVLVIRQDVNYDEYGGHFMETARFKEGFIEALKKNNVELNIANGQSNCAWVVPETERFGHLHRDQDELWIVTKGTLVVVLVDMRVRSSTKGMKTKLILHEGMGVRIPPGVVHGLANYTNEGVMLNYFASMQFSSGSETQEWRFPGGDEHFWDFARPDRI